MTDSNLPSVQLAESIAGQLGQLRRLLALAPPHEAAQILAGVLDYDTGILGEVTQLVETGSRFAKVHSEHGVLPPRSGWPSAAPPTNSTAWAATSPNTLARSSRWPSPPPSSRPTAAPVASAMVIRRRR
ncbi:hypothetical protein NKH18_48000 [Streptomyces sp. M10(2022)]